jgi:hypothetical protein
MKKRLYELVNRVPDISDAEIAEMRHIEPLLGADGMFRRIEGADSLHPRDVSFLWNASPVGDPFTFDTLDRTEIITQHKSSMFFKPSLAEVYGWIRFYMKSDWNAVRFFSLGDYYRVSGETDVICKCIIMGGDLLVKGQPVRFADGSIGHYLVKQVK